MFHDTQRGFEFTTLVRVGRLEREFGTMTLPESVCEFGYKFKKDKSID